MSNNRVYYGEYTLEHWISQMLKGDIELPEYQRHFAWSEENVKSFITQLSEGYFVPTVTIGRYTEVDGRVRNLIIDGQQRLTSILLASLSIFPLKSSFKTSAFERADENDDNYDEGPDSNAIMDWKYSKLLEYGNTKEDILHKITSPPYQQNVDYGVGTDFFKNTVLGFSYLVPGSDDPSSQIKYFSTLFRNINQQGVALSDLESRTSLYYLKPDLKDFFDPPFNSFSVETTVKSYKKMDFVRYLALLSQYCVNERKNEVAYGCKSKKMEPYYEKYVYSVVNDEKSEFIRFTDIFHDGIYSPNMEQLKKNIDALSLPKSYPSIIDMDVFFFGLIYGSLFLNKIIDDDQFKIDQLKAKLNVDVKKFKGDQKHRKSPAGIGNLRNRLESSIKAYSAYWK